MGPAHKNPPTLADVLSCLVSDAQSGDMEFNDFVDEFGYDTDSISEMARVKRIHKLCQKNGKGLKRVLGESFEEVEEALRDYWCNPY